MDNNALDFDLARSVNEYFQITTKEMDLIINEITTTGGDWKKIAQKVGISKNEMDYMERAFRVKGSL